MAKTFPIELDEELHKRLNIAAIEEGLARAANRPGSQRVVWPEDIALPKAPRPAHARRTGTVRGPAWLGPRTVPVRSGLSGLKTSPFSKAPRPAHRLRTGTVRGPAWLGPRTVPVRSGLS